MLHLSAYTISLTQTTYTKSLPQITLLCNTTLQVQYFFITPKLLPDLRFEGNFTVHTIFNGTYVSVTPETKGCDAGGAWDVATVCETGRRLKRAKLEKQR